MKSMLVSTFSKEFPEQYYRVQPLIKEALETNDDTEIKNFNGFFASIEQSLRTGHWYMYIYDNCLYEGNIVYCTPTKYRVEMDALGFNMTARDNMLNVRR